MKQILWLIGALILLTSCQKDGGKSEGDSAQTEQVEGVTSLTVSMDLLTAEQFYQGPGMSYDGDSIYLVLKANIQWPTKVGSYDLSVLQDSILRFGFAVDSGSVAQIMKNFITDSATIYENFDEGAKVKQVSLLPPETFAYENSVTGSEIEVNDRFLSYRVQTYIYQGGAHGFTSIMPFTYDLEKHRVASYDYLLKKGSEPAVVQVIRTNLATQLGIDPSQLAEQGIGDFDYVGQPYLENGMVVFHYDPYAIGPYALGAPDVEVWPSQIENYLTPRAKYLLGL